MNIPTPEQIARLPKWAQEYIEDLDRRTVIAERALKNYTDNQTPSKFYFDDFLCIGEGTPQLSRKYVQTRKITVEHEGIIVDVLLRVDEAGIDISWHSSERLMKEVAMIPISFQQVKLVSRDKMR